MDILKLRIHIGPYFPDDADLPGRIEEAVKENESEFYPLFGRIAECMDNRATLVEDSMEVIDLTLEGSGGCFCARIDYFVYYGCKDMDGSDEIEENLCFDFAPPYIEFELKIPPERGPDEY